MCVCGVASPCSALGVAAPNRASEWFPKDCARRRNILTKKKPSCLDSTVWYKTRTVSDISMQRLFVPHITMKPHYSYRRHARASRGCHHDMCPSWMERRAHSLQCYVVCLQSEPSNLPTEAVLWLCDAIHGHSHRSQRCLQ
jgi:hypothetical protein